MEKLDTIDQMVALETDTADWADDEQIAVFEALQKVNGRERGIIDFFAFYITGNYWLTINDLYLSYIDTENENE